MNMKNTYRYFENRECEYYPCHEGLDGINCLFCYCPMYNYGKCPGECRYIESDGRKIKDCSGCDFPHRAENYDKIIAFLSKK